MCIGDVIVLDAGKFQDYAELEVLHEHAPNLTAVIATNPSLLGPHLVQHKLASQAAVAEIVGVLGLPNRQKAGQLLDLVYAKITPATTKENARKHFNNFLLIIAYPLGHRDIAESLVASLSKLGAYKLIESCCMCVSQ